MGDALKMFSLKNTEKLDMDARCALSLFEENEFSVEKNENGGLTLGIRSFFDCVLILPDGVTDPVTFGNEKIYADENSVSLTDEGDKLCLAFCAEYQSSEDSYELGEIKLLFTEANVKSFKAYNLFDFVPMSAMENPWIYLGSVCELLRRKALANGKLLNKEERELLPLACFLADAAFPLVHEKTAFPEDFVRLARRCGDEKAGELIQKKTSAADGLVVTDKIVQELLDSEHETLWRKVYELLLNSQKDYPSRDFENEFSLNKIEDVRRAIEKTLHEQGFEGEYPSFFKKTDVEFASAVMGGQPVTLINENNISCFVRIFESEAEGEFCFTALSGTRLCRKDGENGDVLSCFFISGARRRGICTEYYLSKSTNELLSLPESAEEFAVIAAKRAELKKLSKTEAKHCGESRELSFRSFLLLAVFAGLLFSVPFTPLMAFMESLETGAPFFQTLKEPIWFRIFVVSGVLFGLLFSAMFAVAVKIAKKR